MPIRLELFCFDTESLQLSPYARASRPADFEQIDQSSVRETAPDRCKPFPYAMAVVGASEGDAHPPSSTYYPQHTPKKDRAFF